MWFFFMNLIISWSMLLFDVLCFVSGSQRMSRRFVTRSQYLNIFVCKCSNLEAGSEREWNSPAASRWRSQRQSAAFSHFLRSFLRHLDPLSQLCWNKEISTFSQDAESLHSLYHTVTANRLNMAEARDLLKSFVTVYISVGNQLNFQMFRS